MIQFIFLFPLRISTRSHISSDLIWNYIKFGCKIRFFWLIYILWSYSFFNQIERCICKALVVIFYCIFLMWCIYNLKINITCLLAFENEHMSFGFKHWFMHARKQLQNYSTKSIHMTFIVSCPSKFPFLFASSFCCSVSMGYWWEMVSQVVHLYQVLCWPCIPLAFVNDYI